MEGFVAFAIISLVVFDLCCLEYLRKSFMSSIEYFVNKILKELAD